MQATPTHSIVDSSIGKSKPVFLDSILLAGKIGSITTINGWPTPNLSGLFDALDRWSLDPRANSFGEDPEHPHARFAAPFRSLAWGSCVAQPIPLQNFRRRYVGTKPIHESHPEALRFCGNFLGYSFGFWLDTDDQALIAELDRCIAVNMARPEYAAEVEKRRVRVGCRV